MPAAVVTHEASFLEDSEPVAFWASPRSLWACDELNFVCPLVVFPNVIFAGRAAIVCAFGSWCDSFWHEDAFEGYADGV